MNGNQVLGYLARNDKWFLGGGKMVIWAPEFPLWLEQPGFWDHACLLDYKVGPLFTLAIVDAQGREVRPRMTERFWQPDHTSHLYRERRHDLVITERRALLPSDTLCSTFEFSHSLQQGQSFDVVVWTAQERLVSQGVYELESCRVRESDGTLIWQRRVREKNVPYDPEQPDAGVMMRLAVALGASRTPDSWSIKTSDRQPNYPHWKYSPFYEKLAEYGGLGNETPAAIDPDFGGLTYLGAHFKIVVPPGERVQLSVYAAIAGSEDAALVGLLAARRRSSSRRREPDLEDQPAPEQPSRERRPTWPAKRHWSDYFESVPSFICSDPYFQKYYWYRWYGLRLNTIRAEDDRLRLPEPCIFEGINLGWFRQHVSFSAQCHMLETRWMHDPAIAQGSLLNFVANQNENGSFPGVIKNILQGDRSLRMGVFFYHANWGNSVREVYRVHPDRAFLEKIYRPLGNYMLYFDRERDPDRTGLYDVVYHEETGMEFMSRYQEVDRQADQGHLFRLKGLDSTVYIFNLQETLAWMAAELGFKEDASHWSRMADTTRRALLDRMWDPQQEFFFDVNPADMQRTAAKAVTGFYPFLAPRLASREHLGAFTRHLFNEDEFWTPYPVPSTSRDDPTFSPDGEWNGRRLVCTWNGRAWPMTTSHVTEALCRAALELDPGLLPRAAELLRRYIRMLFLEGDQERPSSYEYYNPLTGQAPYFRGTEDYMHSWIVDLIIKYVAGVQPEDSGRVRIRPLPFDLDYFELNRLKIAGKQVRVSWRKTESVRPPGVSGREWPAGLSVWVEGELAAQSSRPGPLEINLA